MMVVNTESLESDARSLAEVLERNNIFGLERDEVSEQAKEFFVDMVLRQVEIAENLIIQIEETGVHIELNTEIVDGTAKFSMLKVIPVLSPPVPLPRDPQINYDELGAEIRFIRQWLEMD